MQNEAQQQGTPVIKLVRVDGQDQLVSSIVDDPGWQITYVPHQIVKHSNMFVYTLSEEQVLLECQRFLRWQKPLFPNDHMQFWTAMAWDLALPPEWILYAQRLAKFGARYWELAFTDPWVLENEVGNERLLTFLPVGSSRVTMLCGQIRLEKCIFDNQNCEKLL
jgi:hypothetical protein